MEITNYIIAHKLETTIKEVNLAIKKLQIGIRSGNKISLSMKETKLLLNYLSPVEEYISKDAKFLIINSKLNYDKYELIR
jgi:hypothetical protein